MSLMIGNVYSAGEEKKCTIKIFRDEKDRYFTYLSGTELTENNEEQKFFIQKKVQLRKGLELKNKSVIEVISGWLMPFKFKVEDEETKKQKTIIGDKLFVNEFRMVEEGIDEKQKVKDYSKKQSDKSFQKKQENKISPQDEKKLDNFAFNQYGGGYSPF